MRLGSDLQLKFDLDLDEVETDAQERSISAEQARQISEAARLAFERLGVGMGDRRPETGDRDYHDLHDLRDGERDEGEERYPWEVREYVKLRELGWPWRVAAYIAWAASPKRKRLPRTAGELATGFLGLTSPRAIYSWRQKFPAIDATIAMLQAGSMLESRRDVIDALVASASNPDYKGRMDRKLYFEMTGDYTPKSRVEVGRAKGDLRELSDAELEQLAGDHDLLDDHDLPDDHDLEDLPDLREGEGGDAEEGEVEE